MRHGSLFSGTGGFDLAAQWTGWENVFHCEWNPFGQKILKYYWPNAASYDDITKTDFTRYRGKIDILTGGFPCQPYSTAGKRRGKEDDRHLWPEMLRAIREIQPKWVVGENVSGIISWDGGLVFEEVQTDLETEGYQVQPYVLPAAGIGAPHKRERVWFIAYRADAGIKSMQRSGENGIHGFETSSHTTSDRRERFGAGSSPEDRQQRSAESGELARRSEGFCAPGFASDTNGFGGQRNPGVGSSFCYSDRNCQAPELGRYIISDGPDSNGKTHATNPNGTGLQTPGAEQQTAGPQQYGELATPATNTNELNGDLSGLHTSGISQQQAAYLLGDQAAVLVADTDGNFGCERGLHPDRSEETKRHVSPCDTRLYRRGDWEKFPTQSGVCSGNDGLSARLDTAALLNGQKARGNWKPFSKWRAESIKAAGNAIVPQVAYQIFKAIEMYQKL